MSGFLRFTLLSCLKVPDFPRFVDLPCPDLGVDCLGLLLASEAQRAQRMQRRKQAQATKGRVQPCCPLLLLFSCPTVDEVQKYVGPIVPLDSACQHPAPLFASKEIVDQF